MSSRGREPARSDLGPSTATPAHATKWSGTATRTKRFGHMDLDTIITGHLTQEQLDAYQQIFRIEEASHYLRVSHQRRKPISELLPSAHVGATTEFNYMRDPSPPPKYDNQGNRVNTRDQRIRESLEKERHQLVEMAAGTIKSFTAPSDYRKPAKTFEKLYVPVKDYPDINFVGFLIGPRGRTLNRLQEESGARLQIRGKGSVKEGKSTQAAIEDKGSTGGVDSTEDDLHVLITADAQHKIAKAVQLANEVIEKLITSPEGQNELKREQLKELAVLNGTLRETKPFDPEAYQRRQQRAFDITKIVCKRCGRVGHYARDCNQPQSLSQYGGSSQADSYKPPPRLGDQAAEPAWKKARTESPLPPWQNQRPPSAQYGASPRQDLHNFHQASQAQGQAPPPRLSRQTPPPSTLQAPGGIPTRPAPPPSMPVSRHPAPPPSLQNHTITPSTLSRPTPPPSSSVYQKQTPPPPPTPSPQSQSQSHSSQDKPKPPPPPPSHDKSKPPLPPAPVGKTQPPPPPKKPQPPPPSSS